MQTVEIIQEGFHGFNVIGQNNEFHTIVQSRDICACEDLVLRDASSSFSGVSVKEVQNKILSEIHNDEVVSKYS